MKMRHIIKITENQLRESQDSIFHYIYGTNDAKPFNGQSTITAQGKLDGTHNSEPIIADRIAKQRAPQSWARYRMYGSINKPVTMGTRNAFYEGVEIKTDNQGDDNQDGIDDMFNNVSSLGNGNGIETLSDGDKLNNLTVIPDGVDRKLDILINSIKQSNLTPKQIAIVVNKFQDTFPQLAKNPGFIKSLLRQQVDPNDIRDFN